MAALDDLYGPGSSEAFADAVTLAGHPAPSIEQFTDPKGRVRVNIAWGTQVELKIGCDAEQMIFLAVDPDPFAHPARAKKWMRAMYGRHDDTGGIPKFFRDRNVKKLRIAACEMVPTFREGGDWGDAQGGVSWEL